MKIKILFPLLLLFQFANAQWSPQNSNFRPDKLAWNVSIIDDNVAWCSSFDSTGGFQATSEFTRTLDGGLNWKTNKVTSSTTESFANISAVDANIAYAALFNITGSGSKIYKTTDGGATWSNVTATAQGMFKTGFVDFVHFFDANNGLAVADPGKSGSFEIWRTTDGATSWTKVTAANIPTELPGEVGTINEYQGLGSTVWFSTNNPNGLAPRIFVSSDMGQTWRAYDFPFSGSAAYFNFKSASNGLAIPAYDGTYPFPLYETTNAGQNWTQVNYTGNMPYGDITAVPGTSGRYIAVGQTFNAGLNKVVSNTAFSNNDGKKWNLIDSSSFSKVYFKSTTAGWAGNANIGGKEGLYKVSCSYIIDPASRNFVASGGKGAFNFTSSGSCPTGTLAVQSSCSFVSITNQPSGLSGTVSYTVAANTSSSPRTCLITLGGASHTITQDANSSCTYILSDPTSGGTTAHFSATQTDSSFTIQSNPGTCSWTASASCSFVSINNPSGSGSFSYLLYTVSANTGAAPRTCNISVNGKQFTITQDGLNCNYNLSPTSNIFSSTGGSGNFDLNTNASCTWSAGSSCTFVNIVKSTGTGPATISYTVSVNNGAARSCAIIINGQKHTILQQGLNCTYALSQNSASFSASANPGSVVVNTPGSCTWVASSTCSFVNVLNTSGTGSATISYTLSANSSVNSRTCSIIVGGQTLDITQAGLPCTYALSPSSKSFGASAGTGSFSVNTNGSTCTWTAVASCSFVSILNNSGTGNGTVNYNISANTDSAGRSCVISVNGQQHTIVQDGQAPIICSYTLQSDTASFSSAGGARTFDVLTNGSTCTWTATSNCGFVSLKNNSGSGNGTVSYTVSANPNTVSRTCSITVNGKKHTINQAALPCTYTLSDSATLVSTQGGVFTFNINTNGSNCGWTVSGACAYITVSNKAGLGSATVSYTVAANTSTLPRTCTLIIQGKKYQILQDGVPCTTSINPASQNFVFTASSGSLNVVSNGSNCTWTASSSCSFVNISNANGTGSGKLNFSISANPSTTVRTCTITVNGLNHIITQDPLPCANVLVPKSSSTYLFTGGSGTLSVEPNGSNCNWQIASSCSFVTLSANSGTGTSTVSYTVAVNNTNFARSCSISINNGKSLIINQQGEPCAYTLLDTSAAFLATPGSGIVRINSNYSACSYTANPSCTFVSVINDTLNGNATVSYTIAANNTYNKRTCTIIIAGKVFSIVQDPQICTYAVQPPARPFGYDGGTETFKISTSATCTWVASASCSFVNISNKTGLGSAVVSYTVAANTGAAARTCIININGQEHLIEQDGRPANACNFILEPSGKTFFVNGGTADFDVKASNDSCKWTATASCSFVNISNAAGLGNAAVSYTVSANQSSAGRSCTILVNGVKYEIEQDGVKATCTYTISPAQDYYTSTGGNGTIKISTSAACTWVAESNCGFVHIINSQGKGQGIISYTVDSNKLAAARTCTITVNGQSHVILQDGTSQSLCSFVLQPKQQNVPFGGGKLLCVCAGKQYVLSIYSFSKLFIRNA